MIFDSIKVGTLIGAMSRFPGSNLLLHLFIPKDLKAKKASHVAMTAAKVQRRLDKKGDRPDLLNNVISLMGEPRGMTLLELESNAHILIIAGKHHLFLITTSLKLVAQGAKPLQLCSVPRPFYYAATQRSNKNSSKKFGELSQKKKISISVASTIFHT